MRRRITLAILATVTAVLVLTGVGTLVLDRVAARSRTEHQLRDQAAGLAELMAPTITREGILQRPAVTRLLKGFKLDGFGFVYIGPAGAVRGTPPPGLDLARLDADRLRAGETLSGRSGRLVFAAAPAPAARGTVVAVLTRQVDAAPGAAFGWFALSAAVALVLGAAVAVRLSRALTEPLHRAQQATSRIAGGDLTARVAEPEAGHDDELGDLARSINTMAAGLERSRGLEQQFLLSVSHDLRTPLTSIRGYAEAISDGTAPEAGQAAGVILTEARRLERLVGDLLDLGRLDARAFTFHLQVVPVGEVVGEVVEGFRRQVEEAGIDLEIDEAPKGAAALVDPDRLAQVIANLLENALKHAERSLRISFAAVDGRVAIAIADDGAGIDPIDLPHVFRRHHVATRRPRRSGASSGLGLAIVAELVDAMGGTVVAESPIGPDGGTRVVVTFPLHLLR